MRLKEKAGQAPTHQPDPGQSQEPAHPTPAAALEDALGQRGQMPHFIQYPAGVWEKEGMQMVQETVSFQKWKATDQSLLFRLLPCIKKYACNHDSETFK